MRLRSGVIIILRIPMHKKLASAKKCSARSQLTIAIHALEALRHCVDAGTRRAIDEVLVKIKEMEQ
jgi:hypothetical protein